MRNRLWIVIVVLLMVWIGQWIVSVVGSLPTPRTSESATYWSGDTKTFRTLWWEGWLSVENPADLVVCQARRRW